MDEDIAAIDANTRNQKIKDFFVKFKKHIIFLICTIFLLIFAYFIYVDIQKKIESKFLKNTTKLQPNFILVIKLK